jgi:hypothetical protein
VTAYVATLASGVCLYATEATTCESDNKHGLCVHCGARRVLREAGLL